MQLDVSNSPLARQVSAGVPSPLSRPATALILRELHAPAEVLALLQLRHRVYFEERGYGRPKPFGIDLTAHDTHARLYGLFRGPELVGGLRIVFRHEQSLGVVLQTLRVLLAGDAPWAQPVSLPSEEAFDLPRSLGVRAALVDVEVGRLVVLRPGVDQGAVLEVMIAILGLLLLLPCRFYLYSCARELAARYARVTHPRWTLLEPSAAGIASDEFPFPKASVAAVAAAEDSPYLEVALDYARSFRERGYAELRTAHESRELTQGSAP